VVVLEQYPSGHYHIPADFILFMPGAGGLVEVQSLDDPKVTKIILNP